MRLNLVRSLFACVLSLVFDFVLFWNCSSCLGDSGIPLLVVVVGTTSGIRTSQVSLGIFLEIRRASSADSGGDRVSISDQR